MRAGRWILLLLYLALVGGLFASGLASGEGWAWIVVGVTLTASAVFILGAGHRDLFRPIGRPRILFPIVSASLMLTALFGGLTMALVELFELDDEAMPVVAFWGSLLATWIFWGIVLYIYTRRSPRYVAVHNMARFIFAGSIAELLATVPSHIIVSKRPGCLTGIATGMGLFAGLLVMIWSFGPAIFLLFLQESHRAKDRGRAAKLVTAPTTHKLPQFGLRTLMIVILLIAVACGLLRIFWGEWPVAVVVAWGILLLLVPLLMTRLWIMLVVYVAVFAGLIYTTEGEWWPLAIVMPTGLLGIVLLKLIMFDSNKPAEAYTMTDVPSVVWDYIEGLRTHDVGKVGCTVSEGLAFISAGRTLDKSQFLDMLRALYTAFPDWRYDHSDPEVGGDVIAVKWRQGGTHSGTLVLPGIEPIEATGQAVSIPEQYFFYRVIDEQIVEIRPDPIPGGAPRGILEQIGVKAPPL